MVPQWHGAFEKYSRKWISLNYWKVREHLGSEEDALQQCAMVFAKVCGRYGETVDNPAWMMSLYKTSLSRHWLKLAQKDSDYREHIASGEEVPDFAIPCETSIVDMWQDASEELRIVLREIANAPSGFLDLLLDLRPGGDLNQRLRRVCGIRKQVDIVAELMALAGVE